MNTRIMRGPVVSCDWPGCGKSDCKFPGGKPASTKKGGGKK